MRTNSHPIPKKEQIHVKNILTTCFIFGIVSLFLFKGEISDEVQRREERRGLDPVDLEG